jgi:hypothetical protein
MRAAIAAGFQPCHNHGTFSRLVWADPVPFSHASSLRVLRLANAASKRPFAAYGIAILSVGAATVLGFALSDVTVQGGPFITYFPAIILTTFFCGVYPGVVALLIATIGISFSLRFSVLS